MSLMGFMELMSTSEIPIIAAFFIGLMTAFSPCPLATNITAIAYVSKQNKKIVLNGLMYTLGRALTYTLIASLIVLLGVNIQIISFTLQTYGDKIVGPLLVFIGLIMLDVIKFKFKSGSNKFSRIKESLAKKGYIGSFILGIVLALAFCPFSGVLYFGMLVPLALSIKDPLLTPLSFSFGTGLPVIILSFILAKSIKKLGEAMNKIQTVELWVRRIVSVIFLVIGTYYTLLSFY